jgi:outer membrane protein, multidrug efflux system
MPSLRNRSAIRGLSLCLVLLLAGCKVGRDYHVPSVSTPDQYVESSPTSPLAAADIGSWWRYFHDPELDTLIERGLSANMDVQLAASRIRQARYHEREVRAQAFPSVDTNIGATRTKLSGNSISLGGLDLGKSGSTGTSSTSTTSSAGIPALGLPGTEFNTYQLGFDMSWELDLFGKTRRSVEAAVADTQALAWSLRDSWVSLAAEIAQTYFQLRAAQQRVAVRQAQTARERREIELIRAKVAGRLATALDVQQEDTQLALSEAQLPPLQAEVQIRMHALGVLLGQTPESLVTELGAEAPPLAEPPSIPVGLPSELLQRRPDVRAAERRLAEATAKTGEATADLYPSITLTASPGLVSTALSNLISSGSENASFGASLGWNLFDAGKRRAVLRQANESERQSLLSYQKAVLVALQDVEDALSQLASQSAETSRLVSSFSAAQRAEAIASAQYRAGIAPLTTVLSAQATQLDAEDRLIVARADDSRDTVALYKALGGGWETMRDREGQ